MKRCRLSRLAGMLLLAGACGGHPSRKDCEHATDHMIDIFTAPRVPDGKGVPTELSQAAETWKKALKEKDPVRGKLVETCQSEMTGASISCILAAVDEVTLAKCFGG